MKKLAVAALATSLLMTGCVAAPGGATFQGQGSVTATKPGTTTTPMTQQPATQRPAAQQPSVTLKPGTASAIGKVPAASVLVGAEIGQETAAALAEEQELSDYDALADEEAGAAYSLNQLGAGLGLGAKIKLNKDQAKTLRDKAQDLKAKAEDFKARKQELQAKAAKLELKAEVKAQVAARRTEHRQKIKARLDKMQDARVKIRGALKDAAWVDNGDGTRSKTLSFDVTKTINGKAVVRKATLVRTINADDVLIAASGDFDQQLPGGLHRVSSRTKTLQADGSYAIVFHCEITLAGGAKRVAHWEKTLSADGVLTGSGKIEWFDKDGALKKTVTIALGGSEEEPVASCEDPTTSTETEVTVADDGAIEATVETEAGDTAPVAIDTSADGSVEVAEDTAEVAVDASGAVTVGDAADDADAGATAAADAE